MSKKKEKFRLKRGVTKLARVFSGKIQITNRLKFFALIGSIASVHIFLLVIFSVYQIFPLFVVNIFSILTYMLCFWLMWGEREHYLTIYFVTYTEVILHSLAATLCIGWKFGFAQYIIAIIPVGFYICYTLDIERRKFALAAISGVF